MRKKELPKIIWKYWNKKNENKKHVNGHNRLFCSWKAILCIFITDRNSLYIIQLEMYLFYYLEVWMILFIHFDFNGTFFTWNKRKYESKFESVLLLTVLILLIIIIIIIVVVVVALPIVLTKLGVPCSRSNTD